VTVAAAGGRGRVAAATLLVALAGNALLVALAVLWPILLTRYAHPPSVVLLGVLAHVACVGTGTAVGLLCARPLVARIGWSFCIAVTVVIVTAVQPWLPPVGAAVQRLTAGGPAPVVAAALGVALAGVATGVIWWVDSRR
jgi:hypothetical protein